MCYIRILDINKMFSFSHVCALQKRAHVLKNLTLNFHKTFQEVKIPVPWGHIAGKWWGPTDRRPVLCLHGWQDNSGSFNRLIPLLHSNVGYLAIDYPGHGYSSRIANGLHYHVMVYVFTIHNIVKHFNWPKVSFIGHSMGAITSFIYTMIYPQCVDYIVCLDALKPVIGEKIPVRAERILSQFMDFSKLQIEDLEPPCYDIEGIKKRITMPNSVEYEHSMHIAERNIQPSKNNPDKYFFSRDPRLRVTPYILNYFSQQEILDGAKSVTCPIFIGKSIQTSFFEKKENFDEILEVLKKSSTDCEFYKFDGTHHFHLNDPEELSVKLNNFLSRNYRTE